jgi:hypothetical protein
VLNKIKNLDAADPNHKISYARITLGTNGWPLGSTIKSVGTVVHTKLTIAAAVVRSYRLANIKVCISVHWEKRRRRGKDNRDAVVRSGSR